MKGTGREKASGRNRQPVEGGWRKEKRDVQSHKEHGQGEQRPSLIIETFKMYPIGGVGERAKATYIQSVTHVERKRGCLGLTL